MGNQRGGSEPGSVGRAGSPACAARASGTTNRRGADFSPLPAGWGGRKSQAGARWLWEPEELPAAPPGARQSWGCTAAAALSPSPLRKLLVPVQERPAAGRRGGRAKNTAAAEPGPRGRAEGSAGSRCAPARASSRLAGEAAGGGSRTRRGRMALRRFSPRPPLSAGPRGKGKPGERGLEVSSPAAPRGRATCRTAASTGAPAGSQPAWAVLNGARPFSEFRPLGYLVLS